MAALPFQPVKINFASGVLPPKFGDPELNRDFGHTIGRLSEADATSIVFRYAELEVARDSREAWRAWADHLAGELATAGGWRTDSGNLTWGTVAAEMNAHVDEYEPQFAHMHQLAEAHVALCTRVFEALADSVSKGEVAATGYPASKRDSSPLRYLAGSAAAARRLGRRHSLAVDRFGAATEALEAEAKRRLAFAETQGSVSIADFDSLSPHDFERWSAWLLKRDGCTIVQEHGGPNDEGADVIATTPDGLRVVLQCKHFTVPNGVVQPRYVRELNGTARPEHGADIVGMVTNRRLSPNAEQFATRHGIRIIDRVALERWATYGVPWLPGDSH